MARAVSSGPVLGAGDRDLRRVRGSRLQWYLETRVDVILLVGGTIVAILLRLTLFGSRNGDINNHFAALQTLRTGGFHAFTGDFFGYTPMYYYYVWVADLVLYPHVRDEAILKLGPLLFDFVLAFFVYKLVGLRHREGLARVYAYLAVLFAPTICLNDAYWGQIDSVWAAGVVACVYFVLTRRELLAFAALAFAFCVKLQSVFVLPLLVALALRGKVAWRHFLLLPAAYLVMITPAAIAGRPFDDLLRIYVSQSNEYKELTLNAANVYQWVPGGPTQLSRPGLIWALAVVAALVLALAARVRELTPAQIVACATASVLLVPFVLPHMHERYFFAADALSIALAFYVARGFLVALAIQVASFIQYGPFLFGSAVIPLSYVAFGLLATIVILLGGIARSLARPDGMVSLFPLRDAEGAARGPAP